MLTYKNEGEVKLRHAPASTTTTMSHHPSSPVEYRIDPSLESLESGSLINILEGPSPSRPYRCASAMQAHHLSASASVPQTPLGPVSRLSFQIL